MTVSVGSSFIIAIVIVVALAIFLGVVVLADRRPFFKHPKPRQNPRELPALLGIAHPELDLPARTHVNTAMLVAPVPAGDAREQELVKGPNIASLPEFDPLPDRVEAPVELKVGDNISTDEILPAGAQVLPLRSNIPAISAFVFTQAAHADLLVLGMNTTSTGQAPGRTGLFCLRHGRAPLVFVPA